MRGLFKQVTFFVTLSLVGGLGKEKPMAEVKKIEDQIALVKVINGTVY